MKSFNHQTLEFLEPTIPTIHYFQPSYYYCLIAATNTCGIQNYSSVRLSTVLAVKMQSTSEKNDSNSRSAAEAVLQDGKETAAKTAAEVDEKDVVYPTGLKLALLMVSLLLSVFLVSLVWLLIFALIGKNDR